MLLGHRGLFYWAREPAPVRRSEDPTCSLCKHTGSQKLSNTSLRPDPQCLVPLSLYPDVSSCARPQYLTCKPLTTHGLFRRFADPLRVPLSSLFPRSIDPLPSPHADPPPTTSIRSRHPRGRFWHANRASEEESHPNVSVARAAGLRIPGGPGGALRKWE